MSPTVALLTLIFYFSHVYGVKKDLVKLNNHLRAMAPQTISLPKSFHRPDEALFTIKMPMSAFNFALSSLAKFLMESKVNKVPKLEKTKKGVTFSLENANLHCFAAPEIVCKSDPAMKGLHISAKGGKFRVAGQWRATRGPVSVTGDVVISSQMGLNFGAWLMPAMNEKMERQVHAMCHTNTNFDIKAEGGHGLGKAATRVSNLFGGAIQDQLSKDIIKKRISPLLKEHQLHLDKYTLKCGLRSIEAVGDDVLLSIGASISMDEHTPNYVQLLPGEGTSKRNYVQ